MSSRLAASRRGSDSIDRGARGSATAHRRTSVADSAAAVIVWLLVAFGVLAFGAVYPWAYQPLFAGATMVGCYGLATSRSEDRPAIRLLAGGLALVAGVVLFQLV